MIEEAIFSLSITLSSGLLLYLIFLRVRDWTSFIFVPGTSRIFKTQGKSVKWKIPVSSPPLLFLAPSLISRCFVHWPQPLIIPTSPFTGNKAYPSDPRNKPMQSMEVGLGLMDRKFQGPRQLENGPEGSLDSRERTPLGSQIPPEQSLLKLGSKQEERRQSLQESHKQENISISTHYGMG